MLNFYEFTHDNPTFKKIEVNNLLFTTYDCPIEAAPLDYWTQKNYFTFMLSGEVTWKTPVQEIAVAADDIVFVRKGVHRVYRISDEDFCAILIFMPDDFIRSVIRKNRIRFRDENPGADIPNVIPVEKDETLIWYRAALLQYFSNPAPPVGSLVKVKFEELLLHLMTSPGNSLLVSYFKELSHSGRRSIREVMESHFVFNLTLKEYARLSGRSLATFKRDFAKIYPETPGRWLRKRRLEYGKYLLETTDHHVNQITLKCGFENVSHFIHTFREMYGSTPLEFKKRSKINPGVE